MFGSLKKILNRRKVVSYKVIYSKEYRFAWIYKRNWLTGKYSLEHMVMRGSVRSAIMEAASVIDSYHSCTLSTKEYMVTYHDYTKL